PLRRFGADEVRELLEGHVGGVTQDVVDRVLATTEGNALFVEEVARALASGDSDATLPTGVRDAIGQRLAKLATNAHHILAAGTVLGREIDVTLLAELLTTTPEEIRTSLEEAETAGVVVRLGPDTFSFSHVIVRDVLYRELSPRRRAELHASVADVLAAGNAPERAASEIATHLLEAIDAVGPARAFRASLDAATRAAAAFAFEDAIAILDKALAVIGVPRIDAHLRAEALVVTGEARMRVGNTESGRSACTEAAAIARALGDSKLLAAAALACGAEITIAQIDRTLLTLLHDALAALPEDEVSLRARVLARLAGAEQPAIDPSGPMTRAREAIALARRSGDRFTLRMALQFGGSALVDYADPGERAPLAAEMRDLAIEAGDTPSVFRANLRLFFDHLELGDRSAATADALEIARIAETLGWSRLRTSATMTRACLAAFRGSFGEALELLDLARSPTPAQRETDILFRIGVAFLQDHVEQVEPMTSELRDMWTSAPRQLSEWIEQMVAGARARLGDLDGARTAIRSIARSAACFYVEPPGIQFAAELVAMLDDAEWAAELHPHAVRFASRFASWGQQGMIVFYPFSASVGLLETTLGRFDAAFASFEDAERRATEAGANAALAWTLYWHASARSKGGQTEYARELARRARIVCTGLGFDRLALRIDALLEAASAPSNERPPAPSSRKPGIDLAFALRLDGEVWTVLTPGRELRLKDSRGMRMLARLVSDPGRDVHVMLLAAEGADPGDLGSAGEVLDMAAVNSYRERLDDLRDGIAEAERFGDPSRADKLREELDFLVRELAAGVGLGGRRRTAASAAERARVNVQRRIKDAIRRIGEHDAELGEYLGWTVRTGTFCSFRPSGTRRS
ncbi:MAG TPA: hypothetical protein VM925_16840, partial [Labilithrix sp.]|nr:hypothetical protein [Labilithrix sp.]